MRLSIIIPVYNVEHYLEQCLQSVYNQSLPIADFEVIAINDGSTDRSACILGEYAKRFTNFHFLEQQNQGLSVTRNNGIKSASGSYIMCLDADDYLLPNSIASLLQEAEKNELDLLKGEYRHCNEQGSLLEEEKQNPKRLSRAYQIVNGNILYQELFCEEFYSPLLIMNRQFLLTNNLFFEAGIYFEDIDFALRLSLVANRVMYIPVVFYIYRIRQSSITHTINEKKLRDMFHIIMKLKEYSVQTFLTVGFRTVIEENITRLSVYLLLRLSEYPVSKSNELFQSLNMGTLKPLFVSGGIKERIISSLFNIFSENVITYLRPLTSLKNKLGN